jgi:hypothetical protein
MFRRYVGLILVPSLAIVHALSLSAGGVLETIDITGLVPSPLPGQFVARVIGIRWDDRSIPVQYRVNNTLDPIPNPLGPAFLTVAAASAVTQNSLDQWNNIPTSYIEMHVVGATTNPTVRGFDFVNEVTFRTAASFGAIASSPSVSLIADSTFVAGLDIDGDGDSDVSGAISVASDVDNDGDIEFPAGFYKAGTILDNDVQFNTKVSNGFRFTVNDGDADIVTRSVDLMAVAVHEFGHSHGLSHAMNNQTSASDGTGTTMFPFIDTGDPAAELSARSLDSDDIAWSSFLYPEGTTPSGPGSLQAGDVAFAERYAIVEGDVRHGVLNQPLAGASVFAAGWNSGAMVSSAFSGTTRLSFNPATGALNLVSPAFNIIDGRYRMPVPTGSYQVGVEAVDGAPVPAGSISFTTQIGAAFGQQNFSEELYNGNHEEDLELRSGQAKNVHVNAGEVQAGIDITTSRELTISPFGTQNAIGFGTVVAGRYYAVRIPAADISAINPGQDILVKAAAFNTFVVDASVPVAFAEAMLATGTVNADGSATVDLESPLERVEGFLAQDGDFAPFYFKNPHELGRLVRRGIERGDIEHLFLVLRLPTSLPFPGVSATAPLIGLDGPTSAAPVNDVPIFGQSYMSNDGVVFTGNTAFNFMFSLVLAEPVPVP